MYDWNSPSEHDSNLIFEQRQRISKAVRGGTQTRGVNSLSCKSDAQLEKERLKIENAIRSIAEKSIRKQVVWGKEFQGVPFISKPAEVVFVDFSVGATYEMKLEVTNASYTFNSFRLGNVTGILKDFFTFKVEPHGNMSAGMSCALDVQFRPRLNEDIDTLIPFVAATGPFSIPLRCTTKKCIIEVEPKVVDFADVVVCETVARTIRISNKGAIPTKCFLHRGLDTRNQGTSMSDAKLFEKGKAMSPSGELGVATPEKEEKPTFERMHESHNETETIISSSTDHSPPLFGTSKSDQCEWKDGELTIVELANKGESVLGKSKDDSEDSLPTPSPRDYVHVGAYSTVSLTIRFTPRNNPSRTLRTSLHMSFSDPAVPQCTVLIDATVRDVYIYAMGGEAPIIDFQCCFIEELYRSSVTLANQSKTAVKLTSEVPRWAQAYLEVLPSYGYIQPSAGFTFQFKFTPTRELLHNLRNKKCREAKSEQVDTTRDNMEGDNVESQNNGTVSNKREEYRDHITHSLNDLVDRVQKAAHNSTLHIPVTFRASTQTKPIRCFIHAVLSDIDIQISPASLNFKHCDLSFTRTLTLNLQNTAIVPQKVAFISAPKCFIQQEEVVELLPLEIRTISVGIHPTPAGTSQHYNGCQRKTHKELTRKDKVVSGSLTLQTHRGVEMNIPYSYIPYVTPIIILEPHIQLPVASYDESVSAVIHLRNVTHMNYSFDFGLRARLHGNSLRITPRCGRIAPNELIAIQVELCACREEVDLVSVIQEEISQLESKRTKAQQALAVASVVAPPPAKTGNSKISSQNNVAKDEALLANLNETVKTLTEELQMKMEQCKKIQQDTLCLELDPVGKSLERALGIEQLKWSKWESENKKGNPADPPSPSFYRTFRIPLYMRSGVSLSNRNASNLEKSFIFIQATIIPATLLVQPTKKMSFGELCVQQVVQQSVTLENHSEQTTWIRIESLDPNGPFTLVHYPQYIPPRSGAELCVAFHPKAPATYTLTLKIHSSHTNNVWIPLTAQSLQPEVSFIIESPPPSSAACAIPHFVHEYRNSDLNSSENDEGEQQIHFGSTLINDVPLSNQRSVSMFNKSTFPVTFQVIIPRSSIVPMNDNGTAPFSTSIEHGVLQAQETRTLCIYFNPNHERVEYRARLRIQIGGSALIRTFQVIGCAWERPLYLLASRQSKVASVDTIERVVEDPLLCLYESSTKFFVGSTDLELRSAFDSRRLSLLKGEASFWRYRTSLNFSNDQPSQVLLIGNLKPVSQTLPLVQNAEITVEGLTEADIKAGWKVEPSRMSVACGTCAKISVSFSPKQPFFSSIPFYVELATSKAQIRVIMNGNGYPTPTVHYITLTAEINLKLP